MIMTRLLLVLSLCSCASTQYFGRCTDQVTSGTPDIRDTDYRRDTRSEAQADIAAFRANFPNYSCVVKAVLRTE